MASAPGNAFLRAVLDLMESLLTTPNQSWDGPVMRTGPAMWTAGILSYLVRYCVPPGGNGLYPTCLLPAAQLEQQGQRVTFAEGNGTKWYGVLLPYRAFGYNRFHDNKNRPLENHLVEHQFM